MGAEISAAPPAAGRMSRRQALERELEQDKAQLSDTIDEIKRRTHDASDIRSQARRNPVASVGIALAVGLLFGMMSKPKRRRPRSGSALRRDTEQEDYTRPSIPPVRTARHSGVIGGAVRTLGALAASRVTASVGKAFAEWSDGTVEKLKERYIKPRLVPTHDDTIETNEHAELHDMHGDS